MKRFVAPLFLAIVCLLAMPGDADARPSCSGASGACKWEVELDEITGTHWFGLNCGGGTSWQPIDDATACDLCCVSA